MFVDDMKLARKVSLGLLMVTVQIVLIITFGGGWTQTSHPFLYTGCLTGFSTLVPYPAHATWWQGLTAITMYVALIVSFLYIAWTVAQVVVPDRIPYDLKTILLIDMIVSGVLAVLLLVAYCFFAGGFSGTTRIYTSLGYCFWFAVVASITAVASMIVAGLGWFRN